jgi:hypothetical protein
MLPCACKVVLLTLLAAMPAVRAVLLQGKIKSLEQVYLFSLAVKEYQVGAGGGSGGRHPARSKSGADGGSPLPTAVVIAAGLAGRLRNWLLDRGRGGIPLQLRQALASAPFVSFHTP